jgi:hypothetical protein
MIHSCKFSELTLLTHVVTSPIILLEMECGMLRVQISYILYKYACSYTSISTLYEYVLKALYTSENSSFKKVGVRLGGLNPPISRNSGVFKKKKSNVDPGLFEGQLAKNGVFFHFLFLSLFVVSCHPILYKNRPFKN